MNIPFTISPFLLPMLDFDILINLLHKEIKKVKVTHSDTTIAFPLEK